MEFQVNLDNITILLVRPKIPENIGAAARALKNMGLHHLMVVGSEHMDMERIRKMATHAASDIVDGIQVFDNLKDAVANFQYIAGTTARLGGQRILVQKPSEAAQSLISISKNNRVAVMFGPEDRGLTNEDIRLCHTLINIPTADFSSLNLAQAVMIICYELFKASKEPTDEFVPRLADRYELEGMYETLQEILVRISFINPQNPEYWMTNLRNFFNRYPLRAREVKIIRGICRQVDWYGKKCYQDGFHQKEKEIQP